MMAKVSWYIANRLSGMCPWWRPGCRRRTFPSPPPGVASPKAMLSDREPGERHHAGDGEALHEDRKDVFVRTSPRRRARSGSVMKSTSAAETTSRRCSRRRFSAWPAPGRNSRRGAADTAELFHPGPPPVVAIYLGPLHGSRKRRPAMVGEPVLERQPDGAEGDFLQGICARPSATSRLSSPGLNSSPSTREPVEEMHLVHVRHRDHAERRTELHACRLPPASRAAPPRRGSSFSMIPRAASSSRSAARWRGGRAALAVVFGDRADDRLGFW